MWLAESVYETYREILVELGLVPVSDGIFIPLEDLEKKLALKPREIPELVHDIQHSLQYTICLGQAPGAYRGKRRYHFDGFDWVFMSMYKRG